MIIFQVARRINEGDLHGAKTEKPLIVRIAKDIKVRL